MSDSGLAWILNGSVKYHFLSDSGQAPADWGLRLGLHPTVAVLLSLGAVAMESLVIVGVCSRRYSRRLAAGVAAACLFGGFALFQGVYWYAWWLLLLSFLPWHLVGRTVTAPLMRAQATSLASRPLLPLAQAAVLVAIAGQQLIVSAGHIELDPSDPIRSISLEGRRRLINWNEWRVQGETRTAIAGPIPLGARGG